MSERTRKLRRPFERAAIHFVMALIPRLPRGGVLMLAKAGGRLGYLFDSRGRKIGLANLDVAFGDSKTAAEKHDILKVSFETMARTLLDTFWFAHKPAERLNKYVELDDSANVFFADKPFICITAHFGSWEIMGQMSGHLGYPLSSIATPVKNETVNKHFIRAREATGQVIIPRAGALRKLLSILRKGGKTAFLADQDTAESDGGIWVDFFGLPATITAAPALLAGRIGAQILIGFCIPQPKGRYRIYAAKVMEPPKETDEETIRTLSGQISRATEEEIRKHPQYWLWMYKRWKNKKPGDESAGYPWYTRPAIKAESPTE
jgi:lauroyl/myristoyl acyltransferase